MLTHIKVGLLGIMKRVYEILKNSTEMSFVLNYFLHFYYKLKNHAKHRIMSWSIKLSLFVKPLFLAPVYILNLHLMPTTTFTSMFSR